MSAPNNIQEAALAVIRRLREHGHEALWAGGCVRDMLLGREPADMDVATSARPEQIVTLFRQTRKVGMQFGVVLVKQGSYWIEVATFRQDIDYQDGRRPERVVFTSAEEDACRRDFTINGLFYDPIEQRVIDYVGGRDDLAAGMIRAIGVPAERFAEDHLRMLRAVRFAARFGFQVDPATAGAICEHAPHLTRISPERIREELEKMLTHSSRAQAFALMSELGLMPWLWPGANWLPEKVEQSVAVLNALPEEADFALGFAALLHAWSSDSVEEVARALRSSNRETEDSVWLVAHQGRLADTERLSLAEFKKLAANPRFPGLLRLHRAVCQAHGQPLVGYEAAERLLREIPPEEIAPPPLITGDDLIDLGLTPGPAFKRILDTLYDAQLNKEIGTFEEAMRRLQALLASSNRE